MLMSKPKTETPNTNEHILDSGNQQKIPLLFMAVEDLEYKDEVDLLDDLIARVTKGASEVGVTIDPATLLLTGTEDPRLKRAIKDNIVFAASVEQTKKMIEYSDGNSPLASARTETEQGQNPVVAVWDGAKLENLGFSRDVSVEGNPDYAYRSPDDNLRGALVGIVEFIPEDKLQKFAGTVGKVAIWG